MDLIYHITTEEEWQTARSLGAYTADSLDSEGFIHCSTAGQVLGVANALFAGQVGLVLLAIDVTQLEAEVRYEDCYESGQQFPHIYGPLNLDAVAAVIPFPPQSGGTFVLPPIVRALDVPLLHFDPTPTALLEPSDVLKPIDIPSRCVLCFFNHDVLAQLEQSGRLRQIYALGSEIGPNPVYELEVDGQRLAVCHPGVGAALAAAFMDELIALGCRTFIACGGAGVLHSDLVLGHVVVPTSAVRDEGTSYHYMPPGREVPASADGLNAIENVLQRDQVPYVMGKTWTTDGVYRETPNKIARRRAEGCLTVEMEAASLFAVAQFRRVLCAQILYGGDDLSSEKWDSRHWQNQTSIREKLFWLAAEACLSLPE